MKVFGEEFSLSTKGENTFTNITSRVKRMVEESQIIIGTLNLFLLSTTSSLVICEDEKGLLGDIVEHSKRIAPDDAEYMHNQAWDDDNGRSHVKATLYRQDITVPVRDGDILLGTWQNIFLLEFDVRPRSRRLVITGE